MQKYHVHNHPEREIKSDTEIAEILKKGKYTVISMCKDNDPYIVTMSYGYDAEKKALYFHSSPEGLKLDFIAGNPRVCATVIEDGGYVQGECEHNFRTVVFRGIMTIVTDADEKKHGMNILLTHLEESSEVVLEKLRKSEGFYHKMNILKLDIQQIHGKEGK